MQVTDDYTLLVYGHGIRGTGEAVQAQQGCRVG